MGHRPGTGRMERQVLAALNGQAVDVRELAAQIAGRPPTRSEYNSVSRASHQLARAGLLVITHQPRGKGGGTGPCRAMLLKVSRQVADADGAAAADAELSHGGWLDRCWSAFGQDPGYGEEICEAALKLARRVRDRDGGAAAEARGLEVQDIGR
jgi:hypothetical protein